MDIVVLSLTITTHKLNMELNWALSYVLILLCLTLHSTNAVTYRGTLGMGQSIKTSDTLVSAKGSFELGFFPKQNSTKYYVGIWFKKEKVPIDNIVWVANRKQPVSDSSSAFLTIFKDGNLVVKEGEMVYFVTDIANISTTTTTTRVMLLDSGNLLLLNSSNLNILWQSFDDPTDTLLPGMNLGRDFDSNTSWSLTSWKNAEDPSPGVFSLEVEGGDYMYEKLIIKIKKGSEVYWISDELSNFTFQSYNNRSNTIWNQLGYLTWQGNYTSRLVLEVSGDLNQQFWSQDTNQWVSLQSAKCGRNATCGNFGICNPQAVDPCECLKGFEPYDEDSWNKGDRSAGCVRKTELLCGNMSSSTSNGLNDDRFYHFNDSVDIPLDTAFSFNATDVPTCQRACSANCSCVAGAYDFLGQCLLWHHQVLNLKNISVDVGDDKTMSFFLKLAASEFMNNVSYTSHNSNGRRKAILIIVVGILFVALLTAVLFAYYCRRRKLRGKGEDLLLFDVGMSMKVQSSEGSDVDKVTKVNKREVKLPLFSFASVSAATHNFSAENKLGEGGFGPVYKGKLLNGDEVAVKRLSTRSGQGWEELKNEALLIAKLQHNNLVRLLGCCIERHEKMLIYEFMPNRSLDFFLFDATKSRILDWPTRVRIIDAATCLLNML